ncbi:siderophore ABC transporter substrate-binding protein [Aquibacillus sediminis]|uniref:siderophore ABC transporter substrate-binding protein n=1 Tax=Aquibacillus sediminis TaxID=2574734 RepID=UPI0011085519|nr:siderophore ABC transporter substrate-binding protein [Aquibacillus sediminis]
MYKKYLLIASLFALILFTAACGNNSGEATTAEPEETITVTHELGETPVPLNPEKVVVFDYGTLDSLDQLGIEIAAVPQDSLPSYLAKYEDANYENAGGIKEPDFEKLSEIDPDLIIISGRQQESYEELSELAPTIYSGIDTTRYMESYKENAEILGQIFGKEEEVEAELAEVEASIEELNEQITAEDKNGLVILTNDGGINAYGPGSRFGIIHDEFGINPVDDTIEASTHGQNISFEYISEKDPDYLFVVDRNAVVGGESSAEQALDNPLVQKTKAYQNDNIIYLNPDYWYLSGGGLLSVSEMVKEMAEKVQ